MLDPVTSCGGGLGRETGSGLEMVDRVTPSLFASRLGPNVETAVGVLPTAEEPAVALDESASLLVGGDAAGERDLGKASAARDSLCRDQTAATNTATTKIVAAPSA